MMALAGWYYLHTNGELIFKTPNGSMPEVERGGFVRKVWPCDPSRRDTAWLLCIEALALGANRARVEELAAKWGLTDDDAQHFVAQALADGQPAFKLFRDGDQWHAAFADFVNVQESQCGFGATALGCARGVGQAGAQRESFVDTVA